MVSQNWLTTAEVDRSEWHQLLTILKPAQLTRPRLCCSSDGGSNSSSPHTPDPDGSADGRFRAAAIIVDVGQVPNEPLTFTDETFSRSETPSLPYTWTSTCSAVTSAGRPAAHDKAAVRAMDAATAFLASADGGGVQVKNFIVAGASIARLDHVVDGGRRSARGGHCPIVFNSLNIQQAFVSQWRAYGFWAPAVATTRTPASWAGSAAPDGYADGYRGSLRYLQRFALPSTS